MAEPSQFVFSYKELAEMMVRQTGLKEGLWGVFIKFGIAATNIGETEESLRPAAIVPVLEIGLQKYEQATNLTVDAALVSSSQKETATRPTASRPR